MIMMKKIISKFYSNLLMGYNGERWKSKMISFLEYILFPEFRKKNLPIRKIFRWTAMFIAVYFFGALLINNLVLVSTIKDKDEELHNSYREISNLYTDAKSTVFDECLDSLMNTDDYIRFEIYKQTKIIVPTQVPEKHLAAIKENAEKMGIPLSIYVRVIHHESRFDSSATNPTSGAMGYMQLMPRTFKHFYEVLSLKGGNTALNNLVCGSKLLKQNYDYWYKRKNNQEEAWQMALACYAMGDSLPRALGRVPESVKGYVNYVMQDENF